MMPLPLLLPLIQLCLRRLRPLPRLKPPVKLKLMLEPVLRLRSPSSKRVMVPNARPDKLPQLSTLVLSTPTDLSSTLPSVKIQSSSSLVTLELSSAGNKPSFRPRLVRRLSGTAQLPLLTEPPRSQVFQPTPTLSSKLRLRAASEHQFQTTTRNEL